MPRREYHARVSGCRKSLRSSTSAFFFLSSRMTVSRGLLSIALVFFQPRSRCSKTDVLFLTNFRYSARHSLKSSLRISGDLPMQETEISSSRKIRPSFCTLLNVSRRFLYQKEKLPFQGEY